MLVKTVEVAEVAEAGSLMARDVGLAGLHGHDKTRVPGYCIADLVGHGDFDDEVVGHRRSCSRIQHRPEEGWRSAEEYFPESRTHRVSYQCFEG